MRRPGHSPAPADPVGPLLAPRPWSFATTRALSTFSTPLAARLLGGLSALALGLGLGGCGSPCEQLVTFVCDGGDAAYCAQVEEFIEERQVDADGKPLDAAAAEESCRYIMGNVEIQNAYRWKAKEKLLGAPYWKVLKNMKPAERAAWREKHGIPEPTKPDEEPEAEPADGE